ncbi:MAG: LruC domain-containing protein [Bacteroidetes bacterium]|jgi:LruC domain-containing protein|nr:LruC domain-containing protein [Bacteroidota bacterium]MBT7143533.1 LruC domain-containing protein [Bacteroidota bacterium]MBT7492911.1 LruC domain-containing protein [Bacteroidota bacterium]
MKSYLLKINLNVFLIAAFTIIFVGISACEKRKTNPDDPNLSTTLFQNLEVDASFDWKLTKDIKFNIPNALNRIIKITSVDGDVEYYIGFSNEDFISIDITLPTYVDQVFVNGSIVDVSSQIVEVGYLKSFSSINSISLGTEYVYNNAATDSPKEGEVCIGNISGSSVSFGSTTTINAPLNAPPWTYSITGSNHTVLIQNNVPITINGIQLSYGSYIGVFFDSLGTLACAGYAEYISSNFALSAWGADIGNDGFLADEEFSWKVWDVTTGAIVQMTPTYMPLNPPLITGTNQFLAQGLSGIASLSGTSSITDSDNDGVADTEDDYPNDPLLAFDIYYPSSNRFGTLLFEDLWPSQGDFDFNDLVMAYQFKSVVSPANDVVDIFMTFVVKATGAGFANGFGFDLPDASVNSADINVSGYVSNTGLISYSANGTEASQSLITIIPYDEVPNVGNTTSSGTFNDYDTTIIHISVVGGSYSLFNFALPQFNPFIFIDLDRGHEVHLPSPGYDPTDLVDETLFGTFNDASNIINGIYYRTANNLPWVINIPREFSYPLEKVDISTAYLHLADWASSNGSIFNDWYLEKPGYRESNNLYSTP